MKFCKQCGAQVAEGKSFCGLCGAAVERQPSAAQAAQPLQTPPRPAPTRQQAQRTPPPTRPGPEPQIPPRPAPQNPTRQQAQQVFPQQRPAQPPPQQFPPRQMQQPPQPAAQQYPQSVQQGGQQYAPGWQGAPAKKRRSPLLAVFIPVVVLFAAAAVFFIWFMTDDTATMDFIKIGSDEIPSVRLVIGEERDVTGENSFVEEGVTKKVIAYKVSGNQREEMLKYAQALYGKYGFWYYETDESDFSGTKGVDLRLVKESVEEDHIVIVRIDYDTEGYIITLSRMRGTVTVKR